MEAYALQALAPTKYWAGELRNWGGAMDVIACLRRNPGIRDMLSISERDMASHDRSWVIRHIGRWYKGLDKAIDSYDNELWC